MKKTGIVFVLIITVLTFSNCDKKKNKEIKKTAVEVAENFDWLLGSWKRNNEEEEKVTVEVWEKENDKMYYGIGFTMQNNDTIKQEKMKIIKVDGNWKLTVKVPDETNRVVFSITSIGNEEFTSENKEVDFPNKIKYWKEENKLYALVSGGDMKISFEFEKE